MTYIAASVLALAVMAFLMSRDDQDRVVHDRESSVPEASTSMSGSRGSGSAEESVSGGLTIDDRPVFPENTEFVRVVNPGGEEPHTTRDDGPELPTLRAPLEQALAGGTGRPGSVPVSPESTVGRGVRIAGGAIESSDAGPGESGFYEPGMPPEYGAPLSDVPDEDMAGVDVVVASPEGDNPLVPDIPPEDLNPGTNYPAPEDGDPGIDNPAPEDSGT